MKYLPQRLANEVFGDRAQHLIWTDLAAAPFDPEGIGRLLTDIPALLEEIARLRSTVATLEDRLGDLAPQGEPRLALTCGEAHPGQDIDHGPGPQHPAAPPDPYRSGRHW